MPTRVIRTVLIFLVAATLAFSVGWALADLIVGDPPAQLIGEPPHRASS